MQWCIGCCWFILSPETLHFSYMGSTTHSAEAENIIRHTETESPSLSTLEHPSRSPIELRVSPALGLDDYDGIYMLGGRGGDRGGRSVRWDDELEARAQAELAAQSPQRRALSIVRQDLCLRCPTMVRRTRPIAAARLMVHICPPTTMLMLGLWMALVGLMPFARMAATIMFMTGSMPPGVSLTVRCDSCGTRPSCTCPLCSRSPQRCTTMVLSSSSRVRGA